MWRMSDAQAAIFAAVIVIGTCSAHALSQILNTQ
jgi:hypothetical protein